MASSIATPNELSGNSGKLPAVAMQKGDWVFDGCDLIGKIKNEPYEFSGSLHIDVTIYDRLGERVGRVSPACGGPTHFEPACGADGWTLIQKPQFPISRFVHLTEVLKVRRSKNGRRNTAGEG